MPAQAVVVNVRMVEVVGIVMSHPEPVEAIAKSSPHVIARIPHPDVCVAVTRGA